VVSRPGLRCGARDHATVCGPAAMSLPLVLAGCSVVLALQFALFCVVNTLLFRAPRADIARL